MGATITRGIPPYDFPPLDSDEALRERTLRAWQQAGARGDVHYFSWTTWEELLALAKAHGWEPQGTELALRPGERFDQYAAVGGWLVGDEDARQLGKALHRGVRFAHYREGNADEHYRRWPKARAAHESLRSDPQYRVDAEDLIGFLSRGAFEID